MHHRVMWTALLATWLLTLSASAGPLVYEGTAGPGVGKHLVFLAGDHEYRSEESLPALARILANRHGFKCTVLFTVDPGTGVINPGSNHLPGTEALNTADLMIIFLRFQNLPREQMQPIVEYLKRGGPVVGLRTSTHAFRIPEKSAFARFDYKHADDTFKGGFGRQVLGETWAGHYGKNHVMSTRLDIVPGAKDHPILKGVSGAWVQSGGYWTEPMPDSEVLALARPLNGMTPHSPPAADKKPCPGAWVRTYKIPDGKTGRVFTSTYGASEDLLDAGYRRMLVNACYWAVGLEAKIRADSDVSLVGPYRPTTFRMGGHRRGMKPADLAGWESPIPSAGSTPAPPKGKGRRGKKEAAKAPAGPDEAFRPFGIYAKTAPRPKAADPVVTEMPLKLRPGDRIAFIGNTLLERSQEQGYFEAMLHQRFPAHRLVVRNLAWPADAIDLQPRPANFADTEQHLTHEQADVIFAAFGFNESFAGKPGVADFRKKLTAYVAALKAKAFNGKTAPRLVLVSPTANENIKGVPAADRNNANLALYVEAMHAVAGEQKVGFVDVFEATGKAMADPKMTLTINGCHLTGAGYQVFAEALFRGCFKEAPPKVKEALREAIVDRNRQYFRRFRPLNTFYYTGGRNKTYGYLDFLPAMRNFDIMVGNRDRRVWDLAQGKAVPATVDDSNVPPLPRTPESRGANRWMSAKEELKAFKIDPRFEVNLFAGEEQFPDIAAPIQMRWDARGRLWVSCSTTYPHVYPGNEPNDKIVILEDTDGDGRADKSTVFADNLHIPLSFALGDGGVYVSEMPHLTFLKDTDGDDKADVHQILLTGFGTEDSHHALHDFAWTPGGDLIFRESIFHHSQIETPYGPVRQQNSGWFRFEPATHRLTSFGTYPSTNPWGVTFDDWGQHVASHPVYAAAFHALDPPYPQQHPRPQGLRAYSGVCGHEFVDFKTFPAALRGGFIKVRYKPTNRVEIHKWKEQPFGFDEEYVGDLLFSTNLSFIPVDIRFGPRGALYVCDWYNPVKGHMQYSLRDERRDRHSGRIWRITAKGHALQEPPRIAGAPIKDLLQLLKRPEYRYRYWAKRELRARDQDEVKKALDAWVAGLKAEEPRFRHHQMEAVWLYRGIGAVHAGLLRQLLRCDDHHARAAATRQLRYWYPHLSDSLTLLRKSANDPKGVVRMEAAIAASYLGTPAALDAMLDVFKHPRDGHLDYAIRCALGSHTLRRHWENNPKYEVARLLKRSARDLGLKEPTPTASEAAFDTRKGIKVVKIGCIPERMLFTVERFAVTTGQPVKVIFTNPDATDHNLVIVKPDALAEVGMAANEMARDPRNANSDFIPPEKRPLILHASPMIGPTRAARVHVLRFLAPKEPGIYPYVCTFPGHWVVMKGEMVVARDLADVEKMLAARKPAVVKEWKMSDFPDLTLKRDEHTVMRGMQAFLKARCHQCHAVAGHGINLGPDLSDVAKRYTGKKLLRQLLEPSMEIHEKFLNQQFALKNGRVITGVLSKETRREYHLLTNLLTPHSVTRLRKRDVEEKIPSTISPMPEGLLNVLQREEILDLLAFLEVGYKLPAHLEHKHTHPKK